jgi:hypothetical protein
MSAQIKTPWAKDRIRPVETHCRTKPQRKQTKAHTASNRAHQKENQMEKLNQAEQNWDSSRGLTGGCRKTELIRALRAPSGTKQ